MIANSGFRRGIGCGAQNADEARARGDIDNRARARLAHRPNSVAAAEKGSVCICSVDTPPIFERGVFGVLRGGALFEPRYACIIHHDIHVGIVQRGALPMGLLRHIELIRRPA